VVFQRRAGRADQAVHGCAKSPDIAAAGSIAYFITIENGSFFAKHATAKIWKIGRQSAVTRALRQFPVDEAQDLSQTVLTDNKFYFVADDAVTGKELWVTDGSSPATGTHITRDIYVRTRDANPSLLHAGAGGVYFYTATSGAWIRRDDTGDLVHLIAGDDIYGNGFIGQLGNVEIIAAQNGIWRSDGTAGGTEKDLQRRHRCTAGITDRRRHPLFEMTRNSESVAQPPAPSSCNPTCGWPPITSHSTMRCCSGNSQRWQRIYRWLLANRRHWPRRRMITLTDHFVDSGLTPINFNGLVYFFKRDDTYARSLWKTDGTPAGP